MTSEEDIKDIIAALQEVKEENQVPKNVKIKIDEVIKILNEKTEPSLRVNKVLSTLDEIADDTNIQPFTRTQLWNVVSMLEKI
jgi:uncharacterized protein (UPF0147 family)